MAVDPRPFIEYCAATGWLPCFPDERKIDAQAYVSDAEKMRHSHGYRNKRGP